MGESPFLAGRWPPVRGPSRSGLKFARHWLCPHQESGCSPHPRRSATSVDRSDRRTCSRIRVRPVVRRLARRCPRVEPSDGRPRTSVSAPWAGQSATVQLAFDIAAEAVIAEHPGLVGGRRAGAVQRGRPSAPRSRPGASTARLQRAAQVLVDLMRRDQFVVSAGEVHWRRSARPVVLLRGRNQPSANRVELHVAAGVLQQVGVGVEKGCAIAPLPQGAVPRSGSRRAERSTGRCIASACRYPRSATESGPDGSGSRHSRT